MRNAYCHICSDVFIENSFINWHPDYMCGCHTKCREGLSEQQEKKEDLDLEEESERLTRERFARENPELVREANQASGSQREAVVKEIDRIISEDKEEEERQRLEEKEMERKFMLEMDSKDEAENPGYPVTDVTGIEESLYKDREKRQEDAERKLLDRQAEDWRYDPPTEKQLAALEYYGYKGPEPRTKGEASDLIKKYKEGC